MKERRRYKRIAIKIPVKWRSGAHAKQRRSNIFLFDTYNITRAGLFLKTALCPKKGTRVELELKTAKDARSIKLTGKVIWLARKQKQPHLYPGIGLEFGKIPANDSKTLNAFLRNKFNNFRDAVELKNMYMKLKDMASRLVELEERHSSAIHFRKVLDSAINEIDEVAHILDKEINEIKKM